MPFDVRARDGVWTLTLDTPGSPINVFNRATADQLVELLAQLDRRSTRAVVFESAKPNSFINGVGLLLAHASQTFDDIERAAKLPWSAYQAVHDLPIPTIAVIRGNCFGCGVEFVLNCDYRVAVDTRETQFYMTELNDYLFIPLFGSTWNLPAAVGLEAAVDLLLWGRRWSAREALAGGLVDSVVTHDALDEAVGEFVDDVLDGSATTRTWGPATWGEREEVTLRAARRKVDALPPMYRGVYGDALMLLEAGARRLGTYGEHQRLELERSAASALAPIGKAAYSFFYLRQMASQRAAGRGAATDVTFDTAALTDVAADRFVRDMRSIACDGVHWCDDGRADFRLVPRSREAVVSGDDTPSVVVELATSDTLPMTYAIYAPAYRQGCRLLELAEPKGAVSLEPGRLAVLTRGLQRLGFEVARTSPSRRFVLNTLVVAFLRPACRFLSGQGCPELVHSSLRQFGFVRPLPELLAGWPVDSVAEWLDPELEGGRTAARSYLGQLLTEGDGNNEAVVTSLVDAMCISLLESVVGVLKRREARDAVVLDLIARELLDFPRHLGSLCSWLKKSRVSAAIEGVAVAPHLVSAPELAAAVDFVREGREFYR